jgi:hypothetical protein
MCALSGHLRAAVASMLCLDWTATPETDELRVENFNQQTQNKLICMPEQSTSSHCAVEEPHSMDQQCVLSQQSTGGAALPKGAQRAHTRHIRPS